MEELIAAIATAQVPSGVGIIRLSGRGAADCLARVFRPAGAKLWADTPDRQMRYGTVLDASGQEIDTALAFISRAPRSYTGEDTAELQCHGSPMVLTMVLEALFAAGARQALPGEFTRRAYLNGRLDLAQAEAVIDIIEAETPAAARQAAGQLGGVLSRRVEELYSGLVDVVAHFCAVLDYPDEDIDPFREETIRRALDEGLAGTKALLDTYRRGRQMISGIPCAIVGRPNAGKSSLLNALAGYERAIVTSAPGTTRDTIEVRVNLGGTLLNLIDTAGLRETGDEAERLGVARSRAAAESADLILLVLDGSAPLTPEDEDAIRLAQSAPACICLLSKADLPQVLTPEMFRDRFADICRVSAADGTGLDELEKLAARMAGPAQSGAQALLTNARQAEAVRRAEESLRQALRGLEDGLPPDLLLSDVEEALQALGEVTGRTFREDITGRIFERFCVGK